MKKAVNLSRLAFIWLLLCLALLSLKISNCLSHWQPKCMKQLALPGVNGWLNTAALGTPVCRDLADGGVCWGFSDLIYSLSGGQLIYYNFTSLKNISVTQNKLIIEAGGKVLTHFCSIKYMETQIIKVIGSTLLKKIKVPHEVLCVMLWMSHFWFQ